MKLRWPGFALVALTLLLWQCASTYGWVDTVSVPRVTTILCFPGGRIWRTAHYRPRLVPSLRRLVIGLGLAIVIGMPLGLLMGVNRLTYRLLEPITEIIRPIPSAAYIPVAILFLGLGDQMKIFVITLACVFPILLNTYGGVKGIDPVLIDTGRTLGHAAVQHPAQDRVPSDACRVLLTGIRISLGIALIVSVTSEMIAGNNGLGYFILDKQRTFRVSEVFAGILTLGVLGYVLNLFFLQIERYLLRWRGTTVEAQAASGSIRWSIRR
jgi:ABC-type nitrate/sulfonate/bicarbonate transport system permease component